MVCNLCGVNDATIHLTEINNNQMIEIHLCETCAQEKGTEFKTHFNFAELFPGFADPSAWSGTAAQAPRTSKCPKCGMTYEELAKKGRLGCPHCYEAFDQAVLSMIRRVQRSAQHTGKIPSRLGRLTPAREKNPASDLLLLQQRLRKCIAGEEFEEAAKLRDEIKKMEEKAKKPGRAGPKKGNK